MSRTGVDTLSRAVASEPTGHHWLVRAQEARRFYAKHGRRPSQDEPGGWWLIRQRRASRGKGNEVWTPRRQAWLDANIPGWDDGRRIGRNDDRWLAKAHQVVTFYAEHQRFPTGSKPGGRWLIQVRQDYKGGALAPERKKWLDEHLPGWDEPRSSGYPDEDRWLTKAREVEKFVAEHGRFPACREPHVQWLDNLRQAAHGRGNMAWTSERKKWLDEHLPGWDEPRSSGSRPDDVRWLAKAREVEEFVAEHGRFPTPRDAGPSGRWLTHVRAAVRGGSTGMAWTPERQAWMDEHLPGWNSRQGHAARWLAKAREVETFVAEHDRFPAQREPGGTWLITQRSAARGKGSGAWTPERQAWMDEHLPGWSRPSSKRRLDQDRWLAKAREVEEFVAEHDRFPAQREPGGTWLNAQRCAARETDSGAWTPERQAWMDEHLPGWANQRSSLGGTTHPLRSPGLS